MSTDDATANGASAGDPRKHVLDRYQERIRYYWGGSQYNKRAYKASRYLTIVLGALVTLISSLSSADFVKGSPWLAVALAVATPIFAAALAMVGGFSQTFQWGAAWSDMVITAQRLEKEWDRISVTPAGEIDAVNEMKLLDETVMAETQGFFQRLFGSGGPAKDQPSGAGK